MVETLFDAPDEPERIACDVLRVSLVLAFILTDTSVTDTPGYQPLAYETSQPGIFAAGDARAGSMKRVAAAVGEGSSAIRSIHQHLAP